MKPEITVFAGPNGSGKSTITEILKPAYLYSNADDYQRVTNCTAIDAAIFVEKQRCGLIKELKNFCFETVLSTERYLNMLRYAKNHGYFIKAYFVLTSDPIINVMRVAARVATGGHDVPEDKIISRYYKSLDLLKELIDTVDICHVYDNSTDEIKRIYKKGLHGSWYCDTASDYWSKQAILMLTNDYTAIYAQLN